MLRSSPHGSLRRLFLFTYRRVLLGKLLRKRQPGKMTAMKRKGTQRNRGIILGYFSNLAVEVCPADRPDDSYPSAERQLLQRLEDLRERVHGNL